MGDYPPDLILHSTTGKCSGFISRRSEFESRWRDFIPTTKGLSHDELTP